LRSKYPLLHPANMHARLEFFPAEVTYRFERIFEPFFSTKDATG